jgi:glucosamine--fructose-6-phosphate aminotransferase (isomerizing)
MTTIFEDEIRSQPDVLRARRATGAVQAERVAQAWRDITYCVVGARGSSDNAAMFFQYLAGRELGLVVALATPSLYGEESLLDLSGAGVLAISQSGRSPGIVEILERGRRQDRPCVALTNDPTSPLALESGLVIDMAAGLERAVASTKTFSATWQALAQVVSALKEGGLEGLDDIADVSERVLVSALGATLPLSQLNASRGLTVVGRGVGAAVSAEIALKVREVTGIRAEGYAASDYAHGPIGADGAQSTLLVVVTEEMTDELCELTLEGSRRSGMTTVVLRPASRRHHECDAEIVIDEVLANWALGLASVLVGQVLALRLGELRGRPIDNSPGLSKITLGV